MTLFLRIRTAWRNLMAEIDRPTPYPRDSYDEWKFLQQEAARREIQRAFRDLGLNEQDAAWTVAERVRTAGKALPTSAPSQKLREEI